MSKDEDLFLAWQASVNTKTARSTVWHSGHDGTTKYLNFPMKLDFLNSDHPTTLWSRLKSTHYQIFRLFQRLLLKIKLFRFVSLIEFFYLKFNLRE